METKIKTNFSILILGILILIPQGIYADSSASVRGWAWGGSEVASDGTINGNETGLGWISFNSLNCDANEDQVSDGAAGCPPAGTVAAYGVHVPLGSGPLSGHAWNENVGWISFNSGDLTGCPSGVCSAYRTGDAIHGWARILSPRTAGSNAGGFDGWVKLHSEAGDPISYGMIINPTISPAELNGYAWSDEFGWLSMHDANIENGDNLIICPIATSVTVAGTLQLKAYYRDTAPLTNCSDLDGAILITDDVDTLWGSADTSIATVGNTSPNKGLLTGVAEGGPIRMTVTYNGNSTGMVAQVIAGSPCGNGIVEVGESCDEGSLNNGTCATATDGDGDGETCSSTCQVNICQCIL